MVNKAGETFKSTLFLYPKSSFIHYLKKSNESMPFTSHHAPELVSLRLLPALTAVRISPTGNTDFGAFRPFPPAARKSSVFLRAAAKRSSLHRRRGLKANGHVGQWVVVTGGDDTHPQGAVFVLYGEMRRGVESRHRDAGLRPNISAF